MKTATLPRDYHNSSIWKGWFEYEVKGDEYRAEPCGSGIYAIYKRSGNAFIRVSTIRLHPDVAPSPLTVHAAYLFLEEGF